VTGRFCLCACSTTVGEDEIQAEICQSPSLFPAYDSRRSDFEMMSPKLLKALQARARPQM
jgi:hypothetical protein